MIYFTCNKVIEPFKVIIQMKKCGGPNTEHKYELNKNGNIDNKIKLKIG